MRPFLEGLPTGDNRRFGTLIERPVIDKKLKDLDELEARINAAKDKRAIPQVDEIQGSMLGMAMRMSTELVVSVLVGTGIGIGLDKLFDTGPWITIIGVGFGFAAGIKSTLRTADKMNEASADIPQGKDIGFDDEEQD